MPHTSDKRTSQLFGSWDFITCEYPPDIGGLSEYTQQLAEALSVDGSRVEVWAPGLGKPEQVSSLPVVHRSLNGFTCRDLLRIDQSWRGSSIRRNIILQWVPTGYGYKSLNLFFCLWIFLQTMRGHTVSVMFHEFAYSLSEPKLHLKVAGLVHRFMAAILLNCSRASFASCLPIAYQLERYNFRRRQIRVLPVPSNVPKHCAEEELSSTRKKLASEGDILVGHFGKFSPRVATLLLPSLSTALRGNAKIKVLFIGDGSSQYHADMISRDPDLGLRVFQTGSCSIQQIAEFISACDCMFQPYPDGLCTKRGSAMAALINGKLLISTESRQTEEVWKNNPAVRLIQTENTEQIARELGSVIQSPECLARGGAAAHELYQRNFSIDRTISALRGCSVPLQS